LATNFPAILTAVRPRERTDQYVILAALYTLNATVSPVTAKAVNDLLHLHLGKKAPPNVNASLRAYTSCVAPEISRPLRWWLTSGGLAKLRQLSDLPLSANEPRSSFETDVGIICALESPELSAVIDAFGGEGAWNGVGDASYAHVYRETALVTSKNTKLRVVATASTSMGLTAAAIATTQMIFRFRPRLVVMIGIAAGTRSGNKQFGDVLVADPSVDYSSGKVVDANGIREFLPDPYPLGINPRLRAVLKKYASKDAVFTSIRSRWPGAKPGGQNRLHIGPLGAADQVIDDPSRVLEISKNWRKLVGVEMEAYAVYRACHEAPDPKPRYVSFKAVCDFAAEKTDSWQKYAAYTAAEFMREFLTSEWESLWSQT
jgi:nucleoside phosphorylase